MICYIYKTSIIGCLAALVAHYKVIHLLKSDSNYTCCEGSCIQSFSNLSAFKKHETKNHIEMIPSTSAIIETGNKIKCVINNEILNYGVITGTQGINTFNIASETNEFNYESSVKQLY